MEIQNKLVVEHVFLASVCSCSHVDRQEKRIVQEYCQLNYDTDSCTCGCADESRDEAPKDRSREKKKEQLNATKQVKPIAKVRRIDRLA